MSQTFEPPTLAPVDESKGDHVQLEPDRDPQDAKERETPGETNKDDSQQKISSDRVPPSESDSKGNDDAPATTARVTAPGEIVEAQMKKYKPPSVEDESMPPPPSKPYIRPTSPIDRYRRSSSPRRPQTARSSTGTFYGEHNFEHYSAPETSALSANRPITSRPPRPSLPFRPRQRMRAPSPPRHVRAPSPPHPAPQQESQTRYLPLANQEFRLLRVLPERMSRLKCEIIHHSLNDSPDYIAISYAWGDSLDAKSLVLDGAAVSVATNLHDALKAVRHKKNDTLVWVDALCIDQQNKDERATQIRLMGHIYSRAVSVAIWLGPEADESELAVQLLKEVASGPVAPQRIRSIRNNPDSAALFRLFKRDYWKRLWVSDILHAALKIIANGIVLKGGPGSSPSREEDGILRLFRLALGSLPGSCRGFLGQRQ
jgi:hypothetical protein